MNDIFIALKDSEYINLLYGSIIDWETTDSFRRNKRVKVICGKCHKERMVFLSAFRNRIRKKSQFTGLCNSCSRKEFPPPSAFGRKPSAYKGGRYINGENYIRVMLSEYSQKEQEILEPMSLKIDKNHIHKYVTEHRAVIALFLKRPLLSHEIVHHKNGIRTDNRLENLELLNSRIDHPKGHEDNLLSENIRLRYLLVKHGIDPDTDP